MQRVAAGLFLASFVSPFVCFAADLPSGEALLQRFLDRSGGAEAYARAKNAEMRGTVEIAGMNIRGTVQMVEEGDKSWTAMDIAGIGRIEQGFDGETAWESNAIQGTRLVEGDEKSAMKRSSGLTMALSWKDEYSAARTTGEEESGGRPAWKVEMTPKDGKPEFYFFDKETGLLLRMSAVISTPLGDIAADVALSDYRPVDGIQTPFTMTQAAMGQQIVMHFDSVRYNAALPKDRFALPDEVQALLAKRKGR